MKKETKKQHRHFRVSHQAKFFTINKTITMTSKLTEQLKLCNRFCASSFLPLFLSLFICVSRCVCMCARENFEDDLCANIIRKEARSKQKKKN